MVDETPCVVVKLADEQISSQESLGTGEAPRGELLLHIHLDAVCVTDQQEQYETASSRKQNA